MVRALELLNEQMKTKSLGKVAKELNISKSSLSLVRRQIYPNPYKMYEKILTLYGKNQEIIGICVTNSLDELAKELGCT